jgi:hypothetical protein
MLFMAWDALYRMRSSIPNTFRTISNINRGTPHEFYAIVGGRFLVGAGASGMLDLASVALNGISTLAF